MKALILYGSLFEHGSNLDVYLDNLSQRMMQSGWGLERFHLAEMNIHYCCGCWTCWWKTPGKCVFRDDMEKIYPKIVTADLVIFTAPLMMGFVHSSLKKTMDRLIPLILPYIKIYRGECHHYLRYDKMPEFGVLVAKEPDTDQEDLAILSKSFQRLSLNFQNRMAFVATTETPYEEVLNEINHI